jgi:hypothetical protein
LIADIPYGALMISNSSGDSLPALVQDAVGNRNFPDVVEEADLFQLLDLVFFQFELRSDSFAQIANAERMPPFIGEFIGQRHQDGVDGAAADAGADGGLVAVHAVFGRPLQFIDSLGGRRLAFITDGNRQFDFPDGLGFDHGHDVLFVFMQSFDRGVWQNNRELIAADAGDDIFGVKRFSSKIRDQLQGHVAGFMTQGVIDDLQAVHVEHHQAQRIILRVVEANELSMK